MRGGEAVLEAILDMYPEADLFTLVLDRAKLSPALARRKIRTSFLQRLPGASRYYRHLLPLMPLAVSSLDLSAYDLVISSSHCVAKGARAAPGTKHLSYVHAPMRYIWDRYAEYFGPGRAKWWVRVAARLARPFLRAWDRRVSQPDRVDRIVANSRFIAERVREHYGRDASVVYPFADPERFRRARAPEDFYLMVGAFAPYKRIDLAIAAFAKLGLPLKIVGDGQEADVLREQLATRTGHRIELLGYRGDAEVAELFSRARAFVFPGVEDFGITPVESLCAGAPVIAYAAGGALESVTGDTGIFFAEPTAESLEGAVLQMEATYRDFSEAACRTRGTQFSRSRFHRELAREVEALRKP